MSPSHSIDVELLLAQTSWVPAMARHLVRDADLADDLAQATWAAALEHAPRTGSSRNLRAWLFVVARNLARRMRRGEHDRVHHERAAAAPEATAGPQDELDRVHGHKLLADAVLGLDEPYRSAIAQRYFSELDYDSIAERQGTTNATARKHVSRGLALLRERLDREYDGDRRAWCLALGALAQRGPVGLPTDPAGHAASASGAAFGGLARGLFLAATAGALTVGAWFAFGPVDENTGPEPGVQQDPASRAAMVSDVRNRSYPEHARQRAIDAQDEPTELDAAGTLAIDRERDLHGVVLDAEGTPISGARVAVRREEGRAYPIPDRSNPVEPVEVAEDFTGADGTFSFPLPPGRPHDLFVSHGKDGTAIVSNRYAGERVVVRLERPATLRGQVLRADDGSGIAGVVLRGWTDDNAFYTVFEGVTEPDGSFRFEGLPACHLGLQVMPPDESPLPWIRIDLVGGRTTTIDVPVTRGLRVAGRVTDEETGLPIEGAAVGLGWRFRRPTMTDDDGRYELRGFSAAGNYEVHVLADGYGEGSRLPPPFAHDSATVDIALGAERVVIGRVLDSDGTPIEDAYVAAVGRLRTEQGVPNVDCRSARTDADGRYLIHGLRRGLGHSLFVLHEGHGSVTYELPLRNLDQRRIDMPDVRLAPGATLRGVVVDERGQPLASCQVSLRGTNADYARFVSALDHPAPAGTGHVDRRRGRTDDLGRFTFTDLALGPYRVLASIDGVGIELPVTIDELAATRTPLRITLTTGLGIAGRLTDPEGRPVGGATVAVRTGTDDLVRTRSASDGTFRVLGLAQGPHAVEIVPDRWTASEETRELLPARLEDVHSGRGTLPITLRRGVAITGRILDATGGPVSRRRVAAIDPNGQQLDSMRSRVDGTFALIVEPGAVVDIVVKTRSGEGTPDVRAPGITAGATDLILTLP